MKYLLLLLFTLPLLAEEINTLTPQEKADGWQFLFNGKDLSNFRQFGSDANPGPGWKIEAGIIRKIGRIPGGQIITKDTATSRSVGNGKFLPRATTVSNTLSSRIVRMPQAPNTRYSTTLATPTAKSARIGKPHASTTSYLPPKTNRLIPSANGTIPRSW